MDACREFFSDKMSKSSWSWYKEKVNRDQNLILTHLTRRLVTGGRNRLERAIEEKMVCIIVSTSNLQSISQMKFSKIAKNLPTQELDYS